MMLRFLPLLLAPALFPADRPPAVRAVQIQTIYLLSMGNQLDQYLAKELTMEQVYEVVTDPKRADAVLTDQIGLAFERRLEDLYPAPKPVEEKKAEAEAREAKDEKAPKAPMITSSAPPPSTFSRGKGNIFLVDLKSRRVVWSTYQRPKRTTPDALEATSRRIVARLKHDLTGK